MGLDFAIDELYATGWSALDTAGCEHTSAGRLFPGLKRVTKDFEGAGCVLRVRHMRDFDCFRAEWSDKRGAPLGAVVGRSEAEAAVYALAQWRRQSAAIGA
ncbi:MAG: hypothetical protein IBJ10_05415 [Phycisphaerales bacterium]|nr:hypothetical protein [Phycisphaerales bacterium]